MKALRALSLLSVVLLAVLGSMSAQTWTPIANTPPFTPSQLWLLTDGRVLVQDYPGNATGNWWTLTPDINGSYVNGTWTQVASTPSDYIPLFFASAVLADGRLAIIGGEYNYAPGGTEFTSLGAVYNPKTNTWKNFAAPKGPNGAAVGDSDAIVLADGSFLLYGCCSPTVPGDVALATGQDLHWTIAGSGKNEGGADEEALTLLPNGDALTTGVYVTYDSQIYNHVTGTFGPSINTVVDFVTNNCSEIGPAVLRPDGTILQIGANGNNGVFDSATETWSAAPNLGLGSTDGPASILPNGNVLVALAPVPGCYQTPVSFFEWDGTNFNPAPLPSSPSFGGPTFIERMLVLPTGEVMMTYYNSDVEFYAASGTYNPSWAPTITFVHKKLHPGDLSQTLTGTQLNGLSNGAAFGDDFQDSTNYPLVRITNNGTGHVFYARTHNHSSMGVATGSLSVSTKFDVSCSTELGASQLVVVANGIPSSPVDVTIIPPPKKQCGQ